MEESLKPQQMQERVYLGNNILSGQAIQINGDIQGPVNFRQGSLSAFVVCLMSRSCWF